MIIFMSKFHIFEIIKGQSNSIFFYYSSFYAFSDFVMIFIVIYSLYPSNYSAKILLFTITHFGKTCLYYRAKRYGRPCKITFLKINLVIYHVSFYKVHDSNFQSLFIILNVRYLSRKTSSISIHHKTCYKQQSLYNIYDLDLARKNLAKTLSFRSKGLYELIFQLPKNIFPTKQCHPPKY